MSGRIKFVDEQGMPLAGADVPLIPYVYEKPSEYDQQCGMEFHPQEMVRLGQNGIHLNIDCWTNSTEESTTA